MKEAAWIGLCGRSGSGKGYVSGIFAEMGIPVIDTDAVYRRISGPADSPTECMTELAHAFGEQILKADNSLNRRAMADIVFAPDGAAARERLNRITHSHILRESRRMAQAYADKGCRFVLIDAPLLLIDDLGSEPMMRNITVEYLFTLLNERIANKRHTVIYYFITINHFTVSGGVSGFFTKFFT